MLQSPVLLDRRRKRTLVLFVRVHAPFSISDANPEKTRNTSIPRRCHGRQYCDTLIFYTVRPRNETDSPEVHREKRTDAPEALLAHAIYILHQCLNHATM